MVKSSIKDLSEEKDVEDSKEKEDSGSDEDYEDPGFWSVIHGKEAYFLPREDGAAVLSTSDYTEYKSGASLSDLSLVSKVLMAASGEVHLEISEEFIGLSGEASEA